MPAWVDEDKVPPWHSWDGQDAPQPLLPPSQPAAPEAPAAEAAPQVVAVAGGTQTIEQLRRLCLQRGLSASGDRAALLERLGAWAAAQLVQPEPEAPV
jgi:hypothetical protein